jgi:hypothetical protein
MEEKTVLIIEDGFQITFEGHPKIEDMVGFHIVSSEYNPEVVDDKLVYCYYALKIDKGQQGQMYYEKPKEANS